MADLGSHRRPQPIDERRIAASASPAAAPPSLQSTVLPLASPSCHHGDL